MKRHKDQPPETRAEQNARFGEDVPENDWPEEGDYLWEAFHDIARDRRGAESLGLLLIRAHRPYMLDEEVAILRDMDATWINATNAELALGV